MRCRAAILLALLASLPGLGGCVAAAIPILAAGTMVQGQRERASPDTPVRSAPASLPGDPGQPAAAANSAPAAKTPIEPPAPGAGDRESWDAFYGRALAAAERDPVDPGRRSAFLAVAGALSPETSACGIQPPAVALDLDPAGALFDPAGEHAAAPRLTQALAVLRSRGVDVLWVSGNFPDSAPAIRRTLRASGLDPDSRDEIVLLRYPDDTKQDRREAIGETHCLVAIAGDEHADFDELFAYLIDPDAATALEPLIGDVWFLTPNPLS